jgi:hypothetical protein
MTEIRTVTVPTAGASLPSNMVNFEQTRLSSDGTVGAIARLAERVMASIVPFISSGVFESADIKVMSDAYSKAIENIFGFRTSNKNRGRNHRHSHHNTYTGR